MISTDTEWVRGDISRRSLYILLQVISHHDAIVYVVADKASGDIFSIIPDRFMDMQLVQEDRP